MKARPYSLPVGQSEVVRWDGLVEMYRAHWTPAGWVACTARCELCRERRAVRLVHAYYLETARGLEVYVTSRAIETEDPVAPTRPGYWDVCRKGARTWVWVYLGGSGRLGSPEDRTTRCRTY